MIGLLIFTVGMLLGMCWTFSMAFQLGRNETLYKISLGISIVFSIAYVAWIICLINPGGIV